MKYRKLLLSVMMGFIPIAIIALAATIIYLMYLGFIKLGIDEEYALIIAGAVIGWIIGTIMYNKE